MIAAALLLGGLGEAGLLVAANASLGFQLVCLAVFSLGVGASLAAASDVIMSHAPIERAGMAASIEEVSIELGGAIGITVLGSILAGVYSAILILPSGVPLQPASDGIDQALAVAGTLPAAVAPLLIQSVHHAFGTAYLIAIATNAALLTAVAVMAWRARAVPHATASTSAQWFWPVGLVGRLADKPAFRRGWFRAMSVVARHPSRSPKRTFPRYRGDRAAAIPDICDLRLPPGGSRNCVACAKRMVCGPPIRGHLQPSGKG